jgi:hypothetical protein
MNKKLLVISGVVLIALLGTIIIPVVAEKTDAGLFGRTHIRAIGRNFHICDDDGGVYGHIFIGLKGFKLVFNEDIVIPEENIRWVELTKHRLNCVYIE